MNAKLQIAFAAVWSLLTLGSAQATPIGDCNRLCLEGLVSEYLNALAAHDPWRLPLAPDVKYVENSQELPLGTGEWRVASSPGKYNHVFADPEAGQVAAITTIKENGVGIIYIVRLKVEEDGLISEIETQITRDADGAARYEKMGQPDALWLQTVPVAQRISRAKLISQTDKYYSGMERNDPKGNYSFFDQNCTRIEDGRQTTNLKTPDPYGHSNDTSFSSLSCEAQFQTGFLGFVTQIRERQYPVVDEERQTVFAITTLDHNGTVRVLPSVNGTSSPIPAYFDVPRTLLAAEAFRLRGDKLHLIEMTLTEVPYGKHSGFYAGPEALIQSPGTNRTCNATNCLNNVVEQVLKAFLAHDASSLPLARGVRYSENGQFLSVGDGLWETLGEVAIPGKDDYTTSFTDPETGTAAYWGLTKEQTTPGVLALRIKIEGRKITEIEAINVRAESDGARFGTKTLMRPPLPIEWEADTFWRLDSGLQQNRTRATRIPPGLASAYFDGLRRHSSKDISFLPGCTRRDNGFQGNASCAAQLDGKGVFPNGLFNGTTTVRDQRVLISDSKKGVVLAVAMIDNPATGTPPLPAAERVPSTYMIPQLIKIENGSISHVESMIKWMPFGYTSVWAEEEEDIF